MSGRLMREVLGNPRVWSGLTVLLELLRATSYWFRPAPPGAMIESLITYRHWALILTLSSVLICAGTFSSRLTRLALLGHMIGVFCYFTFGTAIFLGAVVYGLSWASMGSIYVVAILHFCLAIAVGDRLARYRLEGGRTA